MKFYKFIFKLNSNLHENDLHEQFILENLFHRNHQLQMYKNLIFKIIYQKFIIMSLQPIKKS